MIVTGRFSDESFQAITVLATKSQQLRNNTQKIRPHELCDFKEMGHFDAKF